MSDHAEFAYKCTDFYNGHDESGIIWNDPDIGINWPTDSIDELIFSEKDEKWQKLVESQIKYQEVIFMSTILITGGAGFIGSNFIKYMLDKYSDYNIINLDALTYCGNLENLKDVENIDNYNFIKGNIRDKPLVNDLVSKSDYVINFAAESHVDRSITDPKYSSNLMY